MPESDSIKHPPWLTGGDFTLADEPLRLFAAWYEEAVAREPDVPNAMALATVDADGMPNVRMVLLKGFDPQGFVFYTNVESPKGRELDASHKAALLFHWKSLQPAGPAARRGRAGQRQRGRRLFRHPSPPRPDRRLGQQAVGAARKPPRLREGDRTRDRKVRGWNGSKAALLDRLSASADHHGILAGSALPAARPHRIPARAHWRTLEQDAALPVS